MGQTEMTSLSRLSGEQVLFSISTEMAAWWGAIVATAVLPRVINPGEVWQGLIPQEMSLPEMARDGHLVIWATQSHTSREQRARLVIRDMDVRVSRSK